MTDIRAKADQIRREATHKALIAEVRPLTSAKQSMDEWDTGMAAAELRQNDITLCQLVPLIRSLTIRMDAASKKIRPDGITRRSLERQAEDLQRSVDELRKITREPSESVILQAAE